ncbi:hypothetical protein D3C87_1146750 [compost metagenome]
MITTNNDRCFHFAFSHKLVEQKACFRTLSIFQPTNTRWQTLESNAFFSHVQPTQQIFFVREQFTKGIVCDFDVFRITRKCDPTERTTAFTEQRTNEGWNKSRVIKGVRDTRLKCAGTQVVTVIESHSTAIFHRQHAAYVLRHRSISCF